MLAMLLSILIEDPLMTAARSRMAAEQPCLPSADETDITICGMRKADRYRVPFIVHDPGDPAHESLRAERTRLLHRTSPLADLSPFQVGGGMAGVSVMVGGEGGTSIRKPAP
ncbi:MAG TPA: hypothetical protein VNJ10_00295 [Sphingomonas sp.]|nr:hypothetical protein [Sphingomonas sp.]